MIHGLLAAGAAMMGMFGWLMTKDRETREDRYNRVRYVSGAYGGFVAHLAAIHEGRFSWARDMLAFTEVCLDGALQYAPGRRLRITAPYGVSVDDEDRWVISTAADAQAARDAIRQQLLNLDLEAKREGWAEEGYEERSEDERLAHELVDVLSNHVGERGHSEGAVETLRRIIRERDEAVER